MIEFQRAFAGKTRMLSGAVQNFLSAKVCENQTNFVVPKFIIMALNTRKKIGCGIPCDCGNGRYGLRCKNTDGVYTCQPCPPDSLGCGACDRPSCGWCSGWTHTRKGHRCRNERVGRINKVIKKNETNFCSFKWIVNE